MSLPTWLHVGDDSWKCVCDNACPEFEPREHGRFETSTGDDPLPQINFKISVIQTNYYN